MRALWVVLLLIGSAPALAAPPEGEEEAAAAAAPAPAETAVEPAPAPITPPALTRPEIAPEPERAPEVTPTRYSYRWQLILVDTAVTVMSFGVDQLSGDGGGRPGTLATLTIASYFFAAPMVHGAHRQGLRALGSFAMRAGLPLILGVIGEHADDTPDCSTCKDTLRSDGKVIGLTAGVLISMAVDAVLLGRPIYRRVERPKAAWAPALAGTRGGALAGVLGTF